MNWIFKDVPKNPGWYATIYCWDAQEGVSVGAMKWNGKEWESAAPIQAFTGPFKTEAEAEQWAYDNDIEIGGKIWQ